MPIPRQHKGDSKMLTILPSSIGKRDAIKCDISNQGYCTELGKWCCYVEDNECPKNTVTTKTLQNQITLRLLAIYQKRLKMNDYEFANWIGFHKTNYSNWKTGKFGISYESRCKIAKRIDLYNGVK